MAISRRGFVQTLVAAAQEQTGAAVVVRLTDRKVLHIENPNFAAGAVLPPASTIKPFAIMALLEAGKLRAGDQFACTRKLAINGHSLNCVHPPVALPMNPARALAYSCNGAIAHFALRFAPDELPESLIRYGLTSQTGLLKSSGATGEAAGTVQRNTAGAGCQLQALGEEGIAVTPLELVLAYARLSLRLHDEKFAPVREGLEGAVEFGTAQAAQVHGLQVAGKTGSILLRSGAPAAWFAGFAPSRLPRIAVVVLTPGRSGGADAAPIAARLMERYVNVT
jgi:cell division protein FtsI/penicillin-binding protein 2